MHICRLWKFDLTNTVGIRNPTIQNPDIPKIGFQMVRFSNGPVFEWFGAIAIAMVLTIWKPDIF